MDSAAIKFKFVGFPVAIGIDFIGVMLLLGLAWRTPEQLPEWLAVATFSVLMHELAHAAMFDAFGVSPSIRLYAAGGATMGIRLPPRQMILVSAAGPLIGVVFGGFVALLVMLRPALGSEPLIEDLLWVNLGWSFLNLMPFPGLDGGNVLRDLTTLVMGRPAEAASRVAGLVVVTVVFFGLIAAGYPEWALPVAALAVFSTIRMGALSDLMVGRRVSHPHLLILEGRYAEAFDLARTQMAKQPGDPVPMMFAADALRLMTRYEDALWGYERALEMAPLDGHVLVGYIGVLRGLGRTEAADAATARLMALPRDQVIVAQLMALHGAGRFEEGYALVQQAVASADGARQRDPLEIVRALFEYSTGREEAALADTDKAVSAWPDRPDLHEMRALVLIDLGRFGEARTSARRALSAAPLHPEFQQTMGLLERMSGNPEAAVPFLTSSAVASPRSSRAVGELATCYAQLGRTDEAVAGLDGLAAYAADDAFPLYARAAVAAYSGDEVGAAEYLRRASTARPELGVRARWDPVMLTVMATGRAPVGAAGGDPDVDSGRASGEAAAT